MKLLQRLFRAAQSNAKVVPSGSGISILNVRVTRFSTSILLASRHGLTNLTNRILFTLDHRKSARPSARLPPSPYSRVTLLNSMSDRAPTFDARPNLHFPISFPGRSCRAPHVRAPITKNRENRNNPRRRIRESVKLIKARPANYAGP